MPRAAGWVTAAALLLSVSAVYVAGASRPAAGAYQEGPLPRMTGGFGEQTCRQCHLDNPINAPGGSLRLEGLPTAYEPGRTYALTIVLRREALQRAGFELSTRAASGSDAGQQAGRLSTADERTQIVLAPGAAVQYIQHTLAGSVTPTPGEGRWTVTWTAPGATVGPVAIHLAANAANDDASPLGDFIYTLAATSSPR
jgi:hypothetical protein